MLAVEGATAAAAGPAERVVVIPEHEYLRLCNEKGYWQSRHARALEREARLKSEVESLGAQVRELEKRLYGRKSERKAGKGQETGAKSPRAGRPRGPQKGSRGHGRTDRSHLESQEDLRTWPRIRSSARSAAWGWSRFRARKTPRCWRWRSEPASA